MQAKPRGARAAPEQAGLFDPPAGDLVAEAPGGAVAPVRAAAVEAPADTAAAPAGAARRAANPPRRENAQTMAARQREISVSEFFTKNRHLLGFDNPQKALLTAVKEAVDNSLDACEEAGILPELIVEIAELAEDRFRIAIQDNGPGIVRQQVPRVFGQLLYGSKFHRLKQQRGQQGIGISAAGMYGQLTTGRPVRIVSRTSRRKPAHEFQIRIDTQKNAPIVVRDQELDWDWPQGTRVEIEMEATYKKGRRSVDDYVEQTALINPHVRLRYQPPKDQALTYERVATELPREALEIQPHPHGVELGALMQMMKDSPARNLRGMLTTAFSRVGPSVADRICELAGVPPGAQPRRLSPNQVELLFRAIPKVKIMAPPTACLSPVGQDLLRAGLEQRIRGDCVVAVTRSPAVYRGNPFQIEVALAYGGNLPAEEPVELWRFANRVPLQYQQSACAMTKAVLSVDWRKYGLQQSRGALPTGPLVLLVHFVSVWVPFTSESKEALASYPEVLKELRLALMEAGRRLGTFVRRRRREADEHKKRSYIEKYLPTIGEALQQILGLSDDKRALAEENLKRILERTRKA